ncbi:MAG: DUF2855 family protein [Rhodobacteraceae bacterium]|nr:DUF2855 family protein [Paracoccaceae bacterium]
MTTSTTLTVLKSDLSDCKPAVQPARSPAPGNIRVRVSRFGLTANNITYGVVGDRIGYWNFFPTSDPDWGVIPVWGIGCVEESDCPEISVGERLYGYWPMGSHLTLTPTRIDDHRFFDGAPHRAELAAVYNRYLRLSNDPDDDPETDDLRMVLWPLYATSFCLWDFARDNDWFGAEQVAIVSASSKTGIGTGYAFKADPNSLPIIGLTSNGNLPRVEALKLFDQVMSYEEIESRLDATRPTLIIDMSGSGQIISRLHRHLGRSMMFTSHVGLTHYTEAGMGEHYIRDRSEMFFAPGHIAKRGKDWGAGEFEKRSGEFWRTAASESAEWLALKHAASVEEAVDAYRDVLEGKTPPNEAWTVSIP